MSVDNSSVDGYEKYRTQPKRKDKVRQSTNTNANATRLDIEAEIQAGINDSQDYGTADKQRDYSPKKSQKTTRSQVFKDLVSEGKTNIGSS